MLQQTTVAAVLPYYARFVERFPDPAALARARPATVLAAWAGLGYYRRARSLHAAARIVARDHGGRVPDDPAAFAALPGVGRYTAGAVLSMAFDRPRAALDGNVARVFARWFGMPVSHRDPRGARRLWAVAEALVSMRRPGDWNQAVMELGATVCLPRTPRCGACPIAAGCRARALGRPTAFPARPPRRAVVRRRRAVALVERGGRVLVERLAGARLAGLWEPPGVELGRGRGARGPLAARLRALGLPARLADSGRRVTHAITHHRIEVEVWRAAPAAFPPAGPGLRWVAPGRPEVALTALARRLLAG